MAESPKDRRKRSASPPATLLCIDDQEMYLPIRKAYLELQGYAVITATSGREGLELLRTQVVDGVILDYRMPVMDGALVAREIRRMYPGLPIVMLSGFPQQIPDAVRALADAVVIKGQSPSALLEAVRSVLPRIAVKTSEPATPSRESIQETRRYVERVREVTAERKRAVERRQERRRRA